MATRRRKNISKVAEDCGAQDVPQPPSPMRELRSDIDYHSLDDPRKAYHELSNGGTLEELAIALNVLPDTVRHWVDAHPEFASMVRQGLEVSRAWWERMGRTNLNNRNFNNTLFKFFMAERFHALGNSPSNNLGEHSTNTYDLRGATFHQENKRIEATLSPDAEQWQEAQMILEQQTPANKSDEE
jgi:hypothetical protein